MDIDQVKRENVCHFCGQPWEIGHNCEKKLEADLEGLIASMRDELNLMKKR
jgi:hypothetical protein